MDTQERRTLSKTVVILSEAAPTPTVILRAPERSEGNRRIYLSPAWILENLFLTFSTSYVPVVVGFGFLRRSTSYVPVVVRFAQNDRG